MLLRYGGLLVTLLTILGIGVVLLPYFWMVSSSLKTGAEVFELPIRWIPLLLQQRLRSSGCHGGERFLLQPGGLWLGQIPIPLPHALLRLDFEHAHAPAGDHARADLPRRA